MVIFFIFLLSGSSWLCCHIKCCYMLLPDGLWVSTCGGTLLSLTKHIICWTPSAVYTRFTSPVLKWSCSGVRMCVYEVVWCSYVGTNCTFSIDAICGEIQVCVCLSVCLDICLPACLSVCMQVYYEINIWSDRIRLKAKNVMYIRQLLFILNCFIKCMTGELTWSWSRNWLPWFPKNPTVQKTPISNGTFLRLTWHCDNYYNNFLAEDVTKLMKLNDFLFQSHLDNVNFFKLIQYCQRSEISRKVIINPLSYCDCKGGA